MMLKLHVITPLFVLFFLQVFSEEARELELDCISLCKQVDSGFAGICCGQEYCDCDSGSDVPLVCPADEVFCDAIGDCVYIFGQECSETDYCCDGDNSTTTTTTTTMKPDKSYAVLITGSETYLKTAELYVPSSGVSCALPPLPDYRYAHSVESSGLLCGGLQGDTALSCLQWSPDTGTWEDVQLTLDDGRSEHVSWSPGTDIGTYLMGGGRSGRTTTLIKHDGTQEPGFDLKYDTWSACAIPDQDSVIVTGGGSSKNTVSVYTVEGWQQDLPPLNTGRFRHACSSYWSDERRIFMVTGGWETSFSDLDSTEVFDSALGSWAASGAKLPRPMSGLRATNINDRVLIFGGHCDSDYDFFDDILEYNPEEDSMVPVGQMTEARSKHAISVVQAQDFTNWCQ